MATYTGVADVNGDFTIPFSQNYTGGQKVAVKASKDGAEKTIELYAPSSVIGGGVIQFTGNLVNFPDNIGGVVITDSIEIIGASCFRPFDDYSIWVKATSLIISSPVTTIGNSAFFNWKNSKTLSLPDTLKTIGSQSFRLWINATSLTIPNSVTALGDYAFEGWERCQNLVISSNVKDIPSNCFAGWSALKQINIPNGVLSIKSNAFSAAVNCLSLNLPQTVTNIEATAFNSLVRCETITVNAITPPTISANTFNNLKTGCIFKVPAASLSIYKTAPNWSVFSAQMVGF